MIDRTLVADQLRVPTDKDTKYSRGALLLATGSPTYPGAAVLGALGASACGVGILRYAGPQRCENLILASLPEAVIGGGHFDGAVVGSGWDSSMTSYVEMVARECATKDHPLIVDAGALGGVREWARTNFQVVATPHPGEAARMFAQLEPTRSAHWSREHIEEDVRGAALRLADLSGAIVVLKAATTCVATPSGETWMFEAPTAWGATAGAGDVLAGVIGALVVGRRRECDGNESSSLPQAVAAAVGLHGFAAAIAAGVMTDKMELTGVPGHPITASQIAEAIPQAYGNLLLR